MQTITYIVTDPRGIHAHPAGQLVKHLAQFHSSCLIGKTEPSINGKSLLQVMKLTVDKGEPLVLQFDGIDEKEAAHATQAFLKAKL